LRPHWCAMAAAATAALVAVTAFHMPPALAGMSFLFGVGFGLLKIAWIVLAAVYLYDISVATGQFEIMKESVAAITADRPFEVLPAILVVGISFSATQYLWSNHVDSNLVDIASGVVSLVVTVAFLKFWQPGHIWKFADDRAPQPVGAAIRRHTPAEIARAWMPFGILSVMVLLWGLPRVKGAINQATTIVWPVPLLHNLITRAAPVVIHPTPEAARFDFNWLSATGTGCFIAAILAGLLLGLGPVQLGAIFLRTVKRMLAAM